MKKFIACCTFVCAMLQCVFAQQNYPVVKTISSQSTQCITEEQEKEIRQRVKHNVEMLIAEGRMHAPTNAEKLATLKLGWPLKPSSNFTDSNYYAISNFVDHNTTSNVLDWNCGTRTYDGHAGTDIALWPYPWLMMDNKMIKVIAAADGIIVDKHDGEFDRNCSANGQPANYVVLQHSNGYQTIYYHCKKGTITTKAIGASVAKGEVLGYVGSSGSSTGVHLHIGLYDNSGNVIDPYKGNCNAIAKSYWLSQEPYYGEKIHKIMTSLLPIIYPYCPNEEQVNENATIPLGMVPYFTVFLSEIKAGDTVFIKVLKPDNSVWQTAYYPFANSGSFYYLYWAWYLDPAQPKGTWKLKASLGKKNYSYNFTVVDPPAGSPNENYEYQQTSFTAKNLQDDGKMIVSPNPAKTFTHVQFNCDAGAYKLEVINASGLSVQTKNVNVTVGNKTTDINFGNLPAGIYQLHLFNNKTSIYKTVAVEK